MTRWILAMAALLAATSAAAQVSAGDPQSLAQALGGAGYATTITKDDSGNPQIQSSIEATDTVFDIYFFDCTNNAACGAVQFSAAYDLVAPAEILAEWNRDYRFGRGFADTSGGATVQMDVNMGAGGMSQALFLDTLDVWEAVVLAFEKKIGRIDPD